MVNKRDPEATRAAILAAAEDAFLEQGFAEASTSDIARRAGVTKSLIHHHFGSKQKLWTEVKVRRFGEYAQRQQNMLDQSTPTAELLRESLELYFRFLQKTPQTVRLMAWMYLEGDNDCGDLDRAVLKNGVETIRAAQEDGQLRKDVDPRYLLFSFLFLAQHWFQSREHLCRDLEMEGPVEDRDEEYFENMLKIFFEGVLPR
ncbi:MAG: TetR/AcrR family transcriptional regulator [Deltaproteobacteria bacterium]|nr:TetR/AcrR family transcriptional regulator [Deltaproteobacteria bacterium]